jgi:hypothetical protein
VYPTAQRLDIFLTRCARRRFKQFLGNVLGHASVATRRRQVATNLQMKREGIEAFWNRAGLVSGASKKWWPSRKLLRFCEDGRIEIGNNARCRLWLALTRVKTACRDGARSESPAAFGADQALQWLRPRWHTSGSSHLPDPSIRAEARALNLSLAPAKSAV